VLPRQPENPSIPLWTAIVRLHMAGAQQRYELRGFEAAELSERVSSQLAVRLAEAVFDDLY
jgi:hypothetical protein